MADPCILSNAVLPGDFYAVRLPISVSVPRGIVSDGTSRSLIVERGTSSIQLLKDTDGDDLADQKSTFLTFDFPSGSWNFNQGLALHGGYFYASNDVSVYRWPYSSASDVPLGPAQLVVHEIPGGGNHFTRSLAFDSSDRLYVQVGAAANVDFDDSRARMYRFVMNEANFPYSFYSGELFANGLRNAVGFEEDKHGVMWTVDMGADLLFRLDLGGDISNDNPGDKLIALRTAGGHYGYPYCFPEYSLLPWIGMGQETHWAYPGIFDRVVTDADCRNTALYQPTTLALPGHSSPLGLTFYEYTSTPPAGCEGGFPSWMDGYAFLTYHGSFNRLIPTGYKVAYVEMDAAGNRVGQPVDLLAHTPPNAQWSDGFRPVSVDFDDCGRLLVTSDGTLNIPNYVGSQVVRIEYQPNLAAAQLLPTLDSCSPSFFFNLLAIPLLLFNCIC